MQSKITKLKESFISITLISAITIGCSDPGSNNSQPVAPAVPQPTAVPTAPPNRAQAAYLDPRELAADPRAFIGKNIILSGKALNVAVSKNRVGGEYTWVQLMAQVRNRNSTESIVIHFTPKDPKFLKDECYVVYGIVQGTEEVTRALTGAKNTDPQVSGYLWERQPSDRFGNCITN
jgi:hypothetical protein